jgi:hypothetical protein
LESLMDFYFVNISICRSTAVLQYGVVLDPAY